MVTRRKITGDDIKIDSKAQKRAASDTARAVRKEARAERNKATVTMVSKAGKEATVKSMHVEALKSMGYEVKK